jgi:hypothetical protein
MTVIAGPPKDAVEVAFDAIHEGWSSYKTKDGVSIKMRLIVLKFLLAGMDEDGAASLAIGGSLLFAVTAPQHFKGPPNDKTLTNEQIIAAIVERDVPFDTVREEWSEYDVEGVKVGVKLVATIIARTSLFDRNGDPVYHVSYQNVLRAITKPEDKAKFQKIWADRHQQQATSSESPT